MLDLSHCLFFAKARQITVFSVTRDTPNAFIRQTMIDTLCHSENVTAKFLIVAEKMFYVQFSDIGPTFCILLATLFHKDYSLFLTMHAISNLHTNGPC